MKALLSLLLLACLPVQAFGSTYALIGVDLATRGIGAEMSVVGMDRSSRMWFGMVLGAQQGFDPNDSHLFVGAEAGVFYFGVEAGLALAREGTRPRIRVMLSEIFIAPYVEYQPLETPLAVGILLKLPLKL